ncbi:MAG: glycoside hydrolase domain-containing protein [Trebonia sp.]
MAAAVVGGLVLGGVTATSATAATAAKTTAKSTAKTPAKTPAKTKTAASAVAGNAAMKTVVYHGYEFQVPASWPVYRLDQHPATCVRYDVHAVYLGTPGVSMRCPSGLVGRTETVSVIPSTTVAAGAGSEVTDQREQPDGVGGTELPSLPAVDGAVTLNTSQHELRVALGAASAGATVVATYNTDPAVAEQVLGTLRAAPARAPETAQTAPSQALSQPTAERAAMSSRAAAATREPAPAQAAAGKKTSPAQKKTPAKKKTPATKSRAAQPTTTSWRGVPPNWPVQIVLPPPTPVVHPVNGFDSCTAPSLATMRVWRQQYAAIGVYIGGVNDACSYGNLSASWISSAAGMGWGMLPTFVGPQAPCWSWSGPGVRIVPSQAAAEGDTAGEYAVEDAKLFGLAAGSPIYYDMEAYGAGASCELAVLTFISAWDRTVAGAGYLTGVYSSQDSGIEDLQATVAAKTAWFTAPDAIWIAFWNDVATLNDGTLDWPLDERSKQYWGNTYGTVGGITLSIDLDVVGGPLAR